MVPLSAIMAQQPPVAAIRGVLEGFCDDQQGVCAALARAGSDHYASEVLRLFVALVERRGGEVDPDVWEMYLALKTPAKLAELRATTGEPRVVRYDLPRAQHVLIREDRSTLVQHGETGLRTWESSLALAEYVATRGILDSSAGAGAGTACAAGSARPAPPESQSEEAFVPASSRPVEAPSGSALSEPDVAVVELGAGTGLVSLALAQLGLARRVIATDGSPAVVAALGAAAELNALQGVVEPRVVDWADASAVASLPRHSVVLAGDILYGMRATYGSILDALETLRPRFALICNPIRDPRSYEDFKNLARARGWSLAVRWRLEARSSSETDYMFVVSVPPIPLELLELKRVEAPKASS